MASSNEIAQINEINRVLSELNANLNVAASNYLALVGTIEKSNKTTKDATVTQEVLNKAQAEATVNAQKLDALGKQLQSSEEKLKQTEDGRYETIIRNNAASAAARKEMSDKIRLESAAEGSLVKMRQRLSELTAAYDKSGVRTKEAAKEIDKLSREIGKAEAETNRHQRGVGGYADQLGKLPGPIGGAVNGFMMLGKAMWAIVANPIGAIIAAVVASLMLLYKAFTATDTGAVKLAGVLKSIGNVMDILLDRTMSYYNMLWSLVTFDWEGVKKNAKDTFGGITNAIGDAITAGQKYANAMDDIDDREVAAANRMARLRVEIETLKNEAAQSTGKKKIELLEQAMNKEIELNGIEKGFLKERNDAETMNLASKIQNSEMTIEQKEEQLRVWLATDDKEINSMKEKDKAFAEFVNKNEKDFQALQKTKADEVNKETELQQGTRRMQKALYTEKVAIDNEVKEAAKKKTENEEKAALEYAKLREKEIDADERALAAKLKSIDELKSEEEQLAKDLIDSMQPAIDKELEIYDKRVEKSKATAEELKEIEKNLSEAKWDLANEAGNAIFDLAGAKFEKELNQLQVEKDAKLSNAKLTTEQRAKIEADYEKKANEIKSKQARMEKAQALFNIALSTAMGAAKAVAQFPATGGMPFLAFVVAMGALQAAVVAAKPIPKYAKGTDSANDHGIFGESGRELMFTRDGSVVLADKATMFQGSKFKGAKIFTNSETEQIIGASDRNIGGYRMTDERLLSKLDDVRSAILNKPVAIFDKEYRPIGQATSRHQEIYLNRLTRN
jgi:hypothetical protein